MNNCIHEIQGLFLVTSSQVTSRVGNHRDDLEFELLSFWPHQEKKLIRDTWRE